MRYIILLELPLKPMLYFFEVVLIPTVYHSLSGNLKKVMSDTKAKTNINSAADS